MQEAKQIGSVLESLSLEKAKAPMSSLINYETISKHQDPDQKMIAMKYASAPVVALGEKDLHNEARVLLLKIHVVTGWTLPSKEMLMIFTDQFKKTLQESYPTLNSDEIEYAFRQKGTIVEDWGKEMNLNLIDKVLSRYLNQRHVLSASEESKLAPPPQKLYTDEQLLDFQRGDIESFYQRLRKGQVPYNMPAYFKAVLVQDKLLSEEDDVSSFFVQRLGKGFENIYVKREA